MQQQVDQRKIYAIARYAWRAYSRHDYTDALEAAVITNYLALRIDNPDLPNRTHALLKACRSAILPFAS